MKKVAGALLVVSLGIALYYFVFRSYEFKVNFSSNTLPGDVIQTIRTWNRSLDSAQVVEVDSFSHVRQQIFKEGRSYIYDWYFQLDDTTTHISVHVSEPEHRLKNKVDVITGDPPVEKDATELMNAFFIVLKQHHELTSVKLIGEERHPAEFCLCRPIEKHAQFNKAQGMMENFMPMSTFIEASGLKMAGYPSVRLNEWSHSTGKLKYDFCFPIVKTDSMPQIEGLEYKQFDEFTALKAEYHGNYITSDRAWYFLYHYANKEEYKIKGLPIEYFVDNPNFGSNEKAWKADIYLPVEIKE